MNRSVTRFLAGALCALILTIPAGAARAALPRVPQIAFQSASLQAYLNSTGSVINVTTDQMDGQTWTSSISGNTLFTLMIELTANANSNAIGVYNIDDVGAPPAMFQVFPGNAAAGWYAVASFQTSGALVVSLFNATSAFQGQVTYTGVNSQRFAFYLQGPGGTFYSEDSRNAGNANTLVFAGTGRSLGDWWLCFEDTPYDSAVSDFDDAVLLLQSVVPTRAGQHSWGELKRLYH
jgi:hypothetical protein